MSYKEKMYRWVYKYAQELSSLATDFEFLVYKRLVKEIKKEIKKESGNVLS